MTRVSELPIPRQLVTEHQLDLTTDFQPKHSHFRFSSRGELFVLSQLFYNYYRYDKTDDRDFSAFLITRYNQDRVVTAQAALIDLHQELEGNEPLRSDVFEVSLSVTPDDQVVFSTVGNRTYFFANDLRQRMGAFAEFDSRDPSRMYHSNFGYQLWYTQDRAVLCTVGEPNVHLARPGTNLVALSDGPLHSDHRPNLKCITCLVSKLNCEPDCTFSYITLPTGESVGSGCRPQPSLPEQVKARYQLSLYKPWIGNVLPLQGSKCLISVFNQWMRGGTKGCPFLFAIVSYEGKLLGRLEGIDPHDESPFVGHFYDVAVDPTGSQVYYLNKAALFVFSHTGKMLIKIPLKVKELSTLTNFQLGGCSPAGELVFVHPKQHLFMLVPVPNKLEHLAQTLQDSLMVYKKARTRLKNTWRPAQYHWTTDVELIRH